MILLLPLGCIGAGLLLRRYAPARRLLARLADPALLVLMCLIGLNMGASAEVRDNLPRIGLGCVLLCLCSLLGSALLAALAARVLRLSPPSGAGTEPPAGGGGLALRLPLCILAGFLLGWLALPPSLADAADLAFTLALALLYLTVGAALGDVLALLRGLRARMLALPLCVALGSLLGGAVCGLLPFVPLREAVLASAGMGYYSYTGAFLTAALGPVAGAYGFVANVLRDTATVLLLPLLRRLSPFSCIAAGAGGCMDTMLGPVTRALGAEWALPALLSGAAVTLLTTVLLPLLTALL